MYVCSTKKYVYIYIYIHTDAYGALLSSLGGELLGAVDRVQEQRVRAQIHVCVFYKPFMG